MIPLKFTYKNYREEISTRFVEPISIRYGISEYHKDPCWLMLAYDLDKEEEREFKMQDMYDAYIGMFISESIEHEALKLKYAALESSYNSLKDKYLKCVDKMNKFMAKENGN